MNIAGHSNPNGVRPKRPPLGLTQLGLFGSDPFWGFGARAKLSRAGGSGSERF